MNQTSALSTRDARRGTSLMEVLLATVLLLAAVMALSRMAYLARRHAINAEDRTQAQLFCHNIMQEILLGIRTSAHVSPRAFAGDEWLYSIAVDQVDGSAMSRVTVRVDRWQDPSAAVPTEDQMEGFQLVSWMRTARPAPGAVQDAMRGDGEATVDSTSSGGTLRTE